MQDTNEKIFLYSNDIANENKPFEYTFADEDDLEIKTEDVETFKQNFYERYKEIIELLVQKPQVKSLEIKFGALLYYN